MKLLPAEVTNIKKLDLATASDNSTNHCTVSK